MLVLLSHDMRQHIYWRYACSASPLGLRYCFLFGICLDVCRHMFAYGMMVPIFPARRISAGYAVAIDSSLLLNAIVCLGLCAN
jgi:hypothetical protein